MVTRESMAEAGASLVALALRALVVPVTWVQDRQMRKAAALNAETQARAQCRCGICAVTDLLDAPTGLVRRGLTHDHP